MGYGTGAIMAVPGQDQRDWDFAVAFDLPIVRTVQPTEGFDGEAFTGDGPAINCDGARLDGLGVAEAKPAIIAWLAADGLGEATVTYKLRDWLFSRQRYWGEPFPIVYDETGLPIALPDSMLPVELPEVDDYSPRPSTPTTRLDAGAAAGAGRRVGERRARPGRRPDGATAARPTRCRSGPARAGTSCATSTRPTRTASSTPRSSAYWMGPSAAGDVGGVDLYVGGVEHAVLHLLYARFWHKVLYDLGQVSSEEPFHRLVNQGYIQAYAYTDRRGRTCPGGR